MKSVFDMTESELRNAIWHIANSTCPMNGGPSDINEYRHELLRRGLSPEGYHNT